MADRAHISNIKVLMYHRVLDKPPRENSNWHYVLTEDFIKQLKLIDALGYTTITFNDYKLYLEDKLTLPKKPIIITFDDGYLDTYEVACPVLIEHNMSAVIFAMGNREIDQACWEDLDDTELCPLMSSDQLRSLSNLGFEIGAHSMNHYDLTKLRDEEIFKEIAESKETLEKILDEPVHTFAYPYGSLNKRVKKMVEIAGFSFACGVYTGPYRFGDDFFDLRRLAINYHTGTSRYLLRLLLPFQYVEWLYHKTRSNGRLHQNQLEIPKLKKIIFEKTIG